jgi:uncharacterized radical SAM superfamily Fe-S cluster-containing enzyme
MEQPWEFLRRKKTGVVENDGKITLATDADYYRNARNFVKKGEIPARFNTSVKHGCPFDCGLCTDHQQHSCLSVVAPS